MEALEVSKMHKPARTLFIIAVMCVLTGIECWSYTQGRPWGRLGREQSIRPAERVEKEVSPEMTRRFLLNHDIGIIELAPSAEEMELLIADSVGACPDNVTTYMACCGSCTMIYPTKVGTVTNESAAPGLAAMLRQGKDPFGLFLNLLRETGREVFISYRMNDAHHGGDPDSPFISDFSRDHPEHWVVPHSVIPGSRHGMDACLDYSHPEVREYILATIRELVETYDFDGLELDWMRFPRHLSGSPEQVWEKRHFITEFTAAVREVLDNSGRKILLSARIPTNLAGCRKLGLDIAECTRQDLVDFVILAPFLRADYVMPIGEIRAAMGDDVVPIYADTMMVNGTVYHNPESLRAVALSLFDCGADGISVFNWPCWREELAAVPYHWLNGLEAPGGVDLPPVLPASVAAGGSIEFALHLPRAALPAERARFLIDSGGDVSFALNGEQLPDILDLRQSWMFRAFVARAASSEAEYCESVRVFRAEPELLHAGQNRLTVTNTSGRDLTIQRLDLGLW